MKNPEIVGIRFKPSEEVFFLKTLGIELKLKDIVVIRLDKGKEIAKVVHIPEIDEMVKITDEWRILRVVDEEDLQRLDKNKDREKEAFAICESKIKKLKLPMKLLKVIYLFDASRITFYFKAAGKIDFRQLVRQLAAVFKTRIEMRQVGARDETELLGGLGICGRELCCSYWKCRDVKWCRENSGNKAKLVGLCNRALCCLKYESQELDSKHLAELKKNKQENLSCNKGCNHDKNHDCAQIDKPVENIEEKPETEENQEK